MNECSTANPKIEPFLKWAGGKRWLVQDYKSFFDIDFDRYIEPFLGSGAVFFNLQPNKAILSDFNMDLINVYEAIRSDWAAVENYLKIHQKNHSKDYYYLIRNKKTKTIQTSAAKFIYLNRTCWNGLYRVNLNGKFNVPIGTKQNVIMNSDNFEGVSKLLSGVMLESCDFEKTLNKAGKGDFVFVDPPYTVTHGLNGFIKYNEKLFSWSDQLRLTNSIKKAVEKGAKVLATNADHDAIRDIYKDVGEFVSLERSSIISGVASSRGIFKELIIKCY